MNERKKMVINRAQELFLKKGYRNTAIQDILDESGISRGTFYNYFPSKSDLFKAVFVSVLNQYKKQRDDLLIGQDLSDVNIFTKQLEVQMQSPYRHKLFIMVEEVMAANDQELKDYIKSTQWWYINWIFNRLLDVFGQEKKPYLLDSAIILVTVTQQFSYYYYMAKGDKDVHSIAEYCVALIKVLIDELSRSKAILLEPDVLNKFIPDVKESNRDIRYELIQVISDLKAFIDCKVHDEELQFEKIQLIDFIEEELFQQVEVRAFLVKSALLSLENDTIIKESKHYQCFKELVHQIIND